MSNLTKEEYMKALETVKDFSCLCCTCCDETFEERKTNKIKFNSSMQSIKQLINEHFDNPSLKFEELCEDEPVFDKVSKCWRYILQKDYYRKGFYDSINDEWVNFKIDRFYVKEVKDDG